MNNIISVIVAASVSAALNYQLAGQRETPLLERMGLGLAVTTVAHLALIVIAPMALAPATLLLITLFQITQYGTYQLYKDQQYRAEKEISSIKSKNKEKDKEIKKLRSESDYCEKRLEEHTNSLCQELFPNSAVGRTCCTNSDLS